jgi:hypothetical protein
MKKTLFAFFTLVYSINCFSEDNKPQVFLSLETDLCKKLILRFEDLQSKGNVFSGKTKKVFVGESRTKYNPNDYYLNVQSIDYDLNKVDDLIAIDWMGSAGNKFYLGYYIFTDKGYLLSDRKKLKSFLLGEKLEERHGEGKSAVFKREILLQGGESRTEYLNFMGFYKIEPYEFNNSAYIYAESESKNKKIIFDTHNKMFCRV